MASSRKPPAAVVTAAVLTVLLAVLFGGVVAVFGFLDDKRDLAIGGLVIGVLLLVLAWRLLRGGRGAQLGAIAVGAAVVLAGFVQSQGFASLVVFGLLGLALIALLTVPASAREYFGSHRGAVVGR
jgi:predicted anti-sigma-YlaC factor YlaD